MIRPDFSSWLTLPPFGVPKTEKSRIITKCFNELTQWHVERCPEYRRIIGLTRSEGFISDSVEDIPYIPVRLFKEFELRSVEINEIFKTMTSSGTSGQSVSRIFLDRVTASFQTKVLTRLMSSVLGQKRLPMLVVDSPSVLSNRQAFSARGAGVLGFSLFGHDVTYALNESMQIDLFRIEEFLDRHQGHPIFIFGFTYMVWSYFCRYLEAKNISLSIDSGILLHGGGWKKLQDEAVTNEEFGRVLGKRAGIKKVVNYYGMVEQTGSIYLECEMGYLHAPIFSDVVFRDPTSHLPVGIGEIGIIETLSIIPTSYPGHALLTEDLGCLQGEDDCLCGRLGKYFTVMGRLPKAEIRGCSDTYEKNP